MELVREYMNFERGQDPLDAMNIGMRIKRSPITKKEYESGNFTRIENVSGMRDTFWEYFAGNKVNIIMKGIILSSNNKEILLKSFGKQDFIFSSEYKHFCWGFKLDTGQLLILTGNKGTSYEFEQPNYKPGHNTPYGLSNKYVASKKDIADLQRIFEFIIKENENEGLY